MKQGQLIVNCIKLLGDNNGHFIDPSTVSIIDEYKDRTSAIVPSINRALYRLSELKKLPVKKAIINYDVNVKGNIIVDEEIAKDIVEINNVILFTKNNGFYTNVSYFKDGSLFILPPLEENQRYEVVYRPKVKELLENEPYNSGINDDVDENFVNHDSDEIDYPNDILNCIPYFVKGELFEEDDPQLAAYANNKFEVLASQIPSLDNSAMRGVIDEYGLY